MKVCIPLDIISKFKTLKSSQEAETVHCDLGDQSHNTYNQQWILEIQREEFANKMAENYSA